LDTGNDEYVEDEEDGADKALVDIERCPVNMEGLEGVRVGIGR